MSLLGALIHFAFNEPIQSTRKKQAMEVRQKVRELTATLGATPRPPITLSGRSLEDELFGDAPKGKESGGSS